MPRSFFDVILRNNNEIYMVANEICKPYLLTII